MCFCRAMRERAAFCLSGTEKIQEKDISLSPGLHRRKNLYTEILFIYGADKPTELLSLSWSKVSGRKISASGVFDTGASQAVSESSVVDEETESLATEITRRGGSRKWQRNLQPRLGLDNEWKELYTWFQKDGRNKKRSKVF